MWNPHDGLGNRCSWTNRDNDWHSGTVVCSWSDDTPVHSAFNNGTNADFSGVNLYRGANYTDLASCLPRGAKGNAPFGPIFLRSHRWTSGTCGP